MKRKDDKMSLVMELKSKVATACRILHHQGLVDYLGHVSARVPGSDEILINARRNGMYSSLGDVTSEEIALLDIDGKMLGDETGLSIPGETELHTSIFRVRRDVNSVIHTHQPLATAFGIAGRDILPVFNESFEVVASSVPIFEKRDLITTRELGEAMAGEMGENDICILKGHGIVITGRSVEEATLNAINLELQAKMNLIAALLETLRQVPKDRIEPLPERRSLSPSKTQGAWKYYESLIT